MDTRNLKPDTRHLTPNTGHCSSPGIPVCLSSIPFIPFIPVKLAAVKRTALPSYFLRSMFNILISLCSVCCILCTAIQTPGTDLPPLSVF